MKSLQAPTLVELKVNLAGSGIWQERSRGAEVHAPVLVQSSLRGRGSRPLPPLLVQVVRVVGDLKPAVVSAVLDGIFLGAGIGKKETVVTPILRDAGGRSVVDLAAHACGTD